MEPTGRSFVLLLVILSMLGPLTLNILIPSLPGIVVDLATSREMVQLALSLFLAGMAVSQLFVGTLADRFGRRRVLVIALLVYVLASLAAYFARSVEMLIVARIVQAFGGIAGVTLARTMIRDLYARERAASLIGYVTMGMVLAPMIAPSLGAAIDIRFGWRAILLACALLGAASLAVAIIMLPETRGRAQEPTGWAEVAQRSSALLGNERFLAYWGTNAFSSAMFFAFLGGAPYLLIEVMGRSKSEYGIWFILLAVGYMLGNFLSGRNPAGLSVDRQVHWGNLIGLAGGLAIMAPALVGYLHPLAIFGPMLLVSVGNGLVLPNVLASAIGTDPKAGGAASGLLGFGQMGCGALSSYLAGLYSTHSALPLAIIMLTSASAAMVAGIVSRRLAAAGR